MAASEIHVTNRQSAKEVYIRELKKEREKEIYRHAKVKSRELNSMQREAFMASLKKTFDKRLQKDAIWTALDRGELPTYAMRLEFLHLSGFIAMELRDGHPVNLPFLRSVYRLKIPLQIAHRYLDLAQQPHLISYIDENEAALLDEVKEVVKGYLESYLPPSQLIVPPGKPLVDTIIETYFPAGLQKQAGTDALGYDYLARFLCDRYFAFHHIPPEAGSLHINAFLTLRSEIENAFRAMNRTYLQNIQRLFEKNSIRRHLAANPHLQQMQMEMDKEQEAAESLHRAIVEAVPEHFRDLYPRARAMKRHFILHLGPTNSGKTYESIQRLHGALKGIYLGPLRLLAVEQFEQLNLDDVPCSLVTGEEQILVPSSRVQSSTVEMADFERTYDVAVIDECQMICDFNRGGAWTSAILGLCAMEIHLCASPDAEQLLTALVQDCGDGLSIVRHDRKAPLQMDPGGFHFPESVSPGDALIVFSKAKVHTVAAELKSIGWKVSLIYGALPPDVRRDQAESFRRGDTQVVVSTDAIAMGMNLPIRRVIFLESQKYDGDMIRPLTNSEIKQIAGRAGRYGQYDVGYVNAFGFRPMIAHALATPLLPLTEAVMDFPESLLGLPMSLTETLDQWLKMQDRTFFSKASTTRMANLARMMETRQTDKELLYRFLCIPFDETDPDLLGYWKSMYRSEAAGEHLDPGLLLPEQRVPEECTISMLDSMEEEYRLCDLCYNYTRVFLDQRSLLDEIQRRKDLISQGIIHILSTQKLPQKSCKACGKTLPWNWPHRLCEHCYESHETYGSRRRR